MLRIYSTKLIETVDDMKSKKVFDESLYELSDDKDFLNTLKQLKMIVPNEINEFNILNYMFRMKNESNKSLGIFMIPTMQCNFRCPYCYENHVDDFMSNDTYQNTIKFICNTVASNNIKRVTISWFGGEPTLELNNVCEFMNQLRNELSDDVLLIGQMTTNGFILSPKNFERLIESGVTHYQITIDGPKRFHNKTRYLSNGKGSWDIIMDNLLHIKSTTLQFNVMIRTNFTEELVDHADEWFSFLGEKFTDDRRFTYHFETVKNLGGSDTSFVYKDKEPAGVLTRIAKEYGVEPFINKMFSTFSFQCYASDPWNYVIYHDGSIKKCTVAFDSSFNNVGHLLENGNVFLDDNKMAWWTSYDKKDECKSCEIYPICFGTKCPASYLNKSYCDSLKEQYNGTLINYF